VLLFAGFLAYQGKIHILPAILTAIAGATTGATLGYLLGWYGGPSVVNRVLGRFPRLRKRYDDAQRMFLKHGQWAVFAARFITGLRIFAGIVAGVLRMPFLIFLFFSFAVRYAGHSSSVTWVFCLGATGAPWLASWAE